MIIPIAARRTKAWVSPIDCQSELNSGSVWMCSMSLVINCMVRSNSAVASLIFFPISHMSTSIIASRCSWSAVTKAWMALTRSPNDICGQTPDPPFQASLALANTSSASSSVIWGIWPMTAGERALSRPAVQQPLTFDNTVLLPTGTTWPFFIQRGDIKGGVTLAQVSSLMLALTAWWWEVSEANARRTADRENLMVPRWEAHQQQVRDLLTGEN